MDLDTRYDALRSDSDQLIDIANWRSILTLTVFFLSNVIVIFPFRIPLPRVVAYTSYDALVKFRILSDTSEFLPRPYLPVNFLTGPVLAVVLLLATGAINGAVLRYGILGANGIEPLNIMGLFISLAYVALSLDATGLFRFLAFWVARKGGTSGPRLHFYLYLFFLVCATVVGNDPVILYGTPFLAYLTRALGITPPTAWIFSQFTAANMASAVLISSNPTNLVLSGAFSLSFVSYTSSVVLPFVAAALVVYLYLAIVLFRSTESIPSSIEVPQNDGGDGVGIERPGTALIDKTGAVFGSVLFIATLGALVGVSTVGIPVWQVTVPGATLMLSRDLLRDWMHHRAHRAIAKAKEREVEPPPSGDLPIELQNLPLSAPRPNCDNTRCNSTSGRQLALSTTLSAWTNRFVETFPTVHVVCWQMPLTLVPFAFLMFILVEGLTSQGWVRVFSRWWATWVNETGVVGTVGGMLIGSGLLCNICGTNIGTTIFLARMLQDWEHSGRAVSARDRYGSVYGLVLGSNYGAFTLTFSASLAGLLWRDMLRRKGIHVRQYQFAKLNVGTFAVASVVSGVVLIGQTLVVHKTS